MKIIGIGRNYINHAKELNNPIPEKPVFFFMPDTCLLKNNNPFYYPDFTQNLNYELELVIKISKVGKSIAEKFAHRYYHEFALGIDLTARDLQDDCKKNGLPWEIAKAFDNSCPISNFYPIDSVESIHNLNFFLEKNGEIVQKANSSQMIFNIDNIIAYISKFVTLKMGDLIFTGTPEGVGSLKIGDNLVAYAENRKLLDFKIL
ncbi:MAG: fumarylacetoacetate hydrolase family protein [Bacteroidales bacterium]|nr:fumarylacetoacetate hydrolase family protein [Bacteroidales bacterium]